MPRLTIACPVALIDDANQLAAALGESMGDAQTFRGDGWQDAGGNRYAAASGEVSEAWLATVQDTLTRPAWDVDEQIDMDAAARAQAAMVFWTAADETPAPLASPAALTALAGPDGPNALAMMGLSAVQVDGGIAP